MNDRRPDVNRDTEFGLQTCSQLARHPGAHDASYIFHPTLNGKALRRMANRKGVFIGAYVPNQLKEALQQRARSEHRTLSQEITRILEEAIKGKRLPPGAIDRRTEVSGPRRRATDPLPRRREADVPAVSSGRTSNDE